MRRVEGWLLAAIGAVLVSAVVSAAFVGDDEPGRAASGPSPSGTPSPTTPALTVTAIRVTTYASGSHQLVVRATITGGRDPVLKVGSRLVVLSQVGAEVTGTIPVSCAGAIPELVLELTDSAGDVQTRSLGVPRTAWARACATPATGPAPQPTSSSRGS
ncbi:MAG: hypothetical protein JWO22_966 [Frankiales bacterium]|nr:hypothetical protein [Frankiales bacterium]